MAPGEPSAQSSLAPRGPPQLTWPMQVYPSSDQGEGEEVSEPVGRRAASSFPEAATPGPRGPPGSPGSPASAARDDISPHSQRGASPPGNAGGASGRRPPRELTSAPICSSPPHPAPKSQLAGSPSAGLSGPARARQAAHPPCSPDRRLSGGDGAARACMRAPVCVCVGRPGGPGKAEQLGNCRQGDGTCGRQSVCLPLAVHFSVRFPASPSSPALSQFPLVPP